MINSDFDHDEQNQYIRNDYATHRFLQLTIIPTRNCNFSCRYCYQDHVSMVMKDSTAESVIRYLSETIRQFDLVEIGWFGGEPLCEAKRIIDMMRRISCICLFNHVSMYSSVSTNGYLLTPELFDTLYSVGVRNYQITLDGMGAIHDYFRPLCDGDGTFNTIISNLENIKKSQRYDKVKVLIRINFTKRLLPHAQEFLCYLSKLINGDGRFSIDFQKVMDLGGPNIGDIKDEILPEIDLHNLILLANKYGISMNRYESLLQRGGKVCKSARHNAYIIDYDGTIRKCTAALDDAQNNIGYITKDGKMVIDHFKDIDWTQQLVPDKCIECQMYDVCFGKSCPYSWIHFSKIDCPWDEINSCRRAIEECKNEC